MAELFELQSEDVRVFVSPAHGGMIIQILLGGNEILKLDSAALDLTPMSAGGSPILFPFPSKTAGDTYVVDGRKYVMPVHGLVKNASFAVREYAEDRIVLWRDGCTAEKTANYPFDYELELEYRLKGKVLFMEARISNRSDTPMPHYLGWHPYFKATDKSRLKFTYDMKKRYDYVACVDVEAPESLDLSQRWDDVFHSGESRTFTFENPADGYRVRCRMDEAHEVLVVCSWVDGAMCLEPWCGIPNSINNGRFLKWIPAGETKKYCLQWQLEQM